MTDGRLVLLACSPRVAPGLLGPDAWDVLRSAEQVWYGLVEHPQLPALHHAGVQAARLDDPPRALAQRLLDLAARGAVVVWLLDPAGDAALSTAITEALTLRAAAGTGTTPELELLAGSYDLPGAHLLDLVAVMDRLRSPGGCPWDAHQSHESLVRYLVEETYELVEAIETGDRAHLREELGDVLLQVVFHARLASEDSEAAQSFDIDDVAADIIAKLVRRHPHVFGDTQVAGSADVVANWEQLKAAEKPERSGPFDGVPAAQPALAYVEKLQSRAAGLGFDWDLDAEAADRIRLELEEFTAAGNDTEREREIGDLLMSVVGLARRHGLDPEMALRGSARRFRERFEAVVATADRPLAELDRAGWLRLWDAAKAREHVAAPEPDRT